MSKELNDAIKVAFLGKIAIVLDGLKKCFDGDNVKVEAAEKYLKCLLDLYSQMILALNNSAKL